VVASEFAFLALGLLLGIPTGAALLVVIRARPPVPREVRLTVTPDSVPRRRSATLAMDPFDRDPVSARRGPGDFEWNADASAAARLSASPMAGRVGPGPIHATTGSGPDFVMGRVDGSAVIGTPVRSGVAMAVGTGVDPMLAAMRREPGDAAGPTVGRVRVAEPGPARPGITLVDRSVGAAMRTAVAVMDRPGATVAATDGTPRAQADGGPLSDDGPLTDGGPLSDGGPRGEADTDGSGGAAGGGDPGAMDADRDVAALACADERRAVDERCGLAERIRESADVAAEALRDAQRAYDRHVGLADEAAAIADPRAQRAAKDAAQRTFRAARAAAGSRDAVEAAARTWLQDINRINAEAREANVTLAREREAAIPVVASIERLTIQADAARIQAETAQASCIAARESLAVCEEAQSTQTARMPLEPSLAPGEAPEDEAATTRSGFPGEAAPALVGGMVLGSDVDEGRALEIAARGGQPGIMRLLAGDRASMQRIVTAVAGTDQAEQRRWQLLLADFVDAVVARAIEACVFDFPADHPFWSPFTRPQGRDIALALSSLGFRFDGLGGFADDRIPTQRDLSLALGYAGLDPMRVRRWPTEPELASLYREVTVAADEYLAGAAAGLSLGELVTLLGRRADGLTDLWNAWGQVRPLLLEPA
jgi:hypothetical protein